MENFLKISLLLTCVQLGLTLVPTDIEDFLHGNGKPTNRRVFKGPSRFKVDSPNDLSTSETTNSLLSSVVDPKEKARRDSRIMKRDARFFVGNGGTFEIALSFKIPFILIPISDILNPFTGTARQNRDSQAMGSKLGFDSSSLILAGLLGVAGSLLFPGLGSSLGLSKLGTSEKEGRDIYQLNMVDKLVDYLKLYDIDAEACLNVAVCSGSKTSRFKVLEGNATPTNKIVDGLLSYPQVKSILNDTRFKRAFDVGTRGGKCEYKFDSCPFSLDMMEAVVNHWIGYSLGAK